MKMMKLSLTSIQLLFLAAVFVQTATATPLRISTTTSSSSFVEHRWLREENAHSPCMINDLSDACSDTDQEVEHDQLKEECQGQHSLGAAKCYMEYLCENHDQDTVNKHKECIDGECPLARHMPPLDCAAYAQEVANSPQDSETADQSETTTTTTTTETEAPAVNEGTTETASPATEPEATTTEEGQATAEEEETEPPEGGQDETTAEEPQFPNDQVPVNGETVAREHERNEDDEGVAAAEGAITTNAAPVVESQEEGELIHEEAEVTMPPTTTTGGGKKKMGAPGVIMILLVVGVAGFVGYRYWSKRRLAMPHGDANLAPYATRQFD